MGKTLVKEKKSTIFFWTTIIASLKTLSVKPSGTKLRRKKKKGQHNDIFIN